MPERLKLKQVLYKIPCRTPQINPLSSKLGTHKTARNGIWFSPSLQAGTDPLRIQILVCGFGVYALLAKSSYSPHPEEYSCYMLRLNENCYTPVGHISHCKTTSGTNWSYRWTYCVSILNTRRDWTTATNSASPGKFPRQRWTDAHRTPSMPG